MVCLVLPVILKQAGEGIADIDVLLLVCVIHELPGGLPVALVRHGTYLCRKSFHKNFLHRSRNNMVKSPKPEDKKEVLWKKKKIGSIGFLSPGS